MHRALFVAPSAYPLGGVAVWLNYVITGLNQAGWEATAGLVEGRWHVTGTYVAEYPELPFIRIPNATGSGIGRRRALVKAIRSHRPDVVVGVNIADLYPACEELRYEGKARFRTVMSLHGIVSDLLGDLGREKQTIDGVVATNRLACSLCTEMAGMPQSRVHYAPYGVNIGERNTVRKGRSVGEVLKITYAGRLDRAQKRVDTIPEILSYLDRNGVDFKMEIAGEGPGRQELAEDLRPWIQDGRGTMLGTLSNRDMLSLYSRSDALLVTSSWETGPIVIWEAMAAGLPVVTSRYTGSGLEGALKHEENCLMFPVGDAKEAAAQLQRLKDPVLAENLAAAGRELVARRYSIESSVRAWAHALDSIVESDQVATISRPTPPRPAGRLDRFLGTAWAESVRRALGISFTHASPGGEWPHSLSGRHGEREFRRIAARADGA